MTVGSMGHPMPSTNGTSSNGAGPGPSSSLSQASNGHAMPPPGDVTGGGPSSHLHSIAPVRPEGKLMYDDDKNWTDHQDLPIAGPSDRDGDAGGFGAEAGGSTRKRGRGGISGGKRMPVDREEAIRLVLQGLRDMGYNQSADVLEAESGYQLSTRPAADFQSAILGGRWSEALALLPQLGIPSDPPSSSAPEEPASSSSSIASGKSKAIAGGGVGTVAEQARFLVAQQKYLEYLEIGQQKKALAVLRGELAKVTKEPETLHDLSGYMMCLDKEDLYERAQWDGASGSSRRRLLEHLQVFISPQIMVPSRRLATLFDQARRHQALSCIYHEDPEPFSLLVDHECQSGQFPSITTHILADHADEVWRIEWSPDGWYLASAGKDRLVVIWQLQATPREGGGTQYSVLPLHHLREHRDPVDAMAWSPDGKTLVTGAYTSLYLWNAKTGMQKPTPMGASPHNDQISAIQWKADGSEFLVSSMDCKLIFYSASGTVLRQWQMNTLQLIDFVILPDSSRIVAITNSVKRVNIANKLAPSMSARIAEPSSSGPGSGAAASGASGQGDDFGYGPMEHAMMVIRLNDREITDWTQDLKCEISSIKLSGDGKRVIISCSPDEIQLWSLEPHLRFTRKFTGHIQNRFLIRSSFGAVKDRFVLSGSEDGHVYVWQSNGSEPIEVLSGHEDIVNAVAWNPVSSRRIFASCSDDRTIRIWQPPVTSDMLGGEEGEHVQTAEDDAKDGGMAVEEGLVL